MSAAEKPLPERKVENVVKIIRGDNVDWANRMLADGDCILLGVQAHTDHAAEYIIGVLG
jgi:hypothetical protein